MKTISQVAKLTGISTRALQYYDEIGLLKPSSLTRSGYRLYDDEALQKLQQILFFKELGFSLKEIREIMQKPDFDRISALKKQKGLLLLKRNRTNKLIELLTRLEKGEMHMSFKEFDLSDYINALETFKNSNTDDIVKYWGSVENFELFIQKAKDNESQIAKCAIMQFGSVEEYTEAMKYNLEHFSELMEKQLPEIPQQINDLYRELTTDRKREVSSTETQVAVREIVRIMEENLTLNSSTLKYWEMIINVYSNVYVRSITDTRYGDVAADYIVDIGPGAGEHGGEVIACGTAEEIMKNPNSLTGAYLSGKQQIPVPKERRKPTGFLKVVKAAENNLKDVTVEIPLGVMTCVTGVSGSGKSSLTNEVLYKTLQRKLNHARTIPGKHKEILGMEQLDKVIDIDQSPIGRTPRSNPATYTGVFDMIRDLFAATPDAKAKGYKKGRFSFNVKGGRCEACSGDGILKVEMHFLPDVYVPCEVCGGKRYNRETLEVKYKGKSIYDILNMTVEEALEFFKNVPSIERKIQTLYDVGLSYIRLGQPSTELSGGEAQRIKLATELSRRSTGKTIYILDEPTTGLHFEDVRKLIEILRRLSQGGNTVVVIEHNLDVIKTADYIIDMGPEGGDGGGTVIAKGTPEEVAESEMSYTGKYIRKYLKK